MKILEKIKYFIQNIRMKPKMALPPASENINNQNVNEENENNPTNEKTNKNNGEWIIKNIGKSNTQPTKLDVQIDQFLQDFSDLVERSTLKSNNDIDRMAYKALVSMRGMPITQDEYDKNYYGEQLVLDEIKDEGKYTVQTQGGKDNPLFYHIKSLGHTLPDSSDLARIYINCNNGNIAELSKLILECNNNSNFYLKFSSNISNSRRPRGEKIVIYCHNDEINYIVQLINYTKNIRPDLYKESENVLPFLQSIDNTISIAAEPLSNQFTGLDGKIKILGKSTNSFISNILRESYIGAVQEIAANDENLSFLLQNDNIENQYLYLRNYNYVNHNYHDYLLSSMKAKMGYLSIKNNVYIDGIYKETGQPNEKKHVQDYEQGERK